MITSIIIHATYMDAQEVITTNMLTETEFTERTQDACENDLKLITLEKWNRIEINTLLKMSSGAYCTPSIGAFTNAATCGYCKLYYSLHPDISYAKKCMQCPLELNVFGGCSDSSHIWKRFITAISEHNGSLANKLKFEMINLIKQDIENDKNIQRQKYDNFR